ncbi:MAG: sulfurtransferase TusA family protein [Acetobacteraceae bacterium]|nr:sulfurtransferase TusA family protein [Acetobacteraceae bacterium]
MQTKDRREALAADHLLDIRSETCPMTYVRVRLALDRMSSGQTLRVLLQGDEPRENVPKTALAQGHSVIDTATDADGVTRLLIRRA